MNKAGLILSVALLGISGYLVYKYYTEQEEVFPPEEYIEIWDIKNVR